MDEMKWVGVREFLDHTETYLSGSDPIAVSEDDHLIGIYVPLERAEPGPRAAIEHVDQIVERLLQDVASDENELRTGLQLSRIRLHAQRR